MMRLHVVEVADLFATDDEECTLVTYALGSCIAVSAYDPRAKIGGLIHYMLPDSRLDPEKASAKPAMFADTGINLLLHLYERLGGSTKRVEVKLAGGAQILSDKGLFNIGKRNYLAARKTLWGRSVMVDGEAVGGRVSRTIRLSLADGSLLISTPGQEDVAL